VDFATGETMTEEAIVDRIVEYARTDFLTDGEREWLAYARKYLNKTGLEAQKTANEVYNKSMGFIENYWPLFVDYKRSGLRDLSDEALDAELGQVISGLFKKVNTEQGFTQKRTGALYHPVMNARDVFYRHIDDAVYYAKLQGVLKIVKTTVHKSKEAWGDAGVKYWDDYVNILALHGKMKAVDKFGVIVEKLKNNATVAILGANIGSIVKQFMNMIDAFQVSGKVPLANMARVLDKKVWAEIHEKSKMLRFRNAEVMRLNVGLNPEDKAKGIFEATKDFIMIPFRTVDLWTGTALWKSVYDDAILTMTEEAAIRKADNISKYAISSPFLEDLPFFVVNYRRGVTSPLTAFQTATLNHFSMLRYAGGKEAEEKFGKWGALIVTIGAGLVLYSLADVIISDKAGKLKGSTYNAPFLQKFAESIVSQFGPIGLLVGRGKFGDLSAKSVADAFGGIIKTIVSMEPGSRTDTQKAIIDTITAAGTILGVPGAANIPKYIKAGINALPDTPTNSRPERPKTIRPERPSRPERVKPERPTRPTR